MDKYSKEELLTALEVVNSTISKCEKIQPKFAEGSSQHTLLKNRIKALYISKSLIVGEEVFGKYSEEELAESLAPISSIISKCEKAQSKFEEGTVYRSRLDKIINAMKIAKSLIEAKIS